MKKYILILAGISISLLTLVSCKKENNSNNTKAVFSYVADGFVVNFTDFSQNAAEYTWDFGDQSTPSNKSNPTHIYSKKGDYLVSLMVSKDGQTSTFQDSVYVLGPNVKIDGDFTDWEHVGYSYENAGTSGGTILAVKTFASAGSLNFYLEGTEEFSLAVLDLYLDSDNNPETGFKTWMYPAASGADFLLEGNYDQATPAASAGSMFKHTGADNGWGWTEVGTFGDVINFSAMKTVEGRNAVEFSIRREALGSLKNQVNFALVEMNSGWSEVGALPVSKEPTSAFAKIDL